MSPTQRRFKNVINRVGEAFTVGGNARQGIFAFIAPGAARTYMDAATIDSVGRPLRAAYVPYDDPTTTGNTVTYASATYTVQKALDLRHRNEAVARLLLMV